MFWEKTYSYEFPRAVKTSGGVCLLPIGCVETHGNHCALGCDTLIIEEICRVATEKEDCMIFPKQYFGEKTGAGEFPGTIIFSNRLIQRILTASCDEIYRNGFRKIVLVNGHGGNTATLNHVARQVIQKNPGYMVFVYGAGLGSPKAILENLEDYPYLTEEDLDALRRYVEEKKFDGHGGFNETAMLMSRDEKYVNLDNYGTLDGRSNRLFAEYDRREIFTPFGWMGSFPNSLTCSPHDKPNPRLARALMQETASHLTKAIRFLKNDENLLAYHKLWLEKQVPHDFDGRKGE